MNALPLRRRSEWEHQEILTFQPSSPNLCDEGITQLEHLLDIHITRKKSLQKHINHIITPTLPLLPLRSLLTLHRTNDSARTCLQPFASAHIVPIMAMDVAPVPRADDQRAYQWEQQPDYAAACCSEWPGAPTAYGKLHRSPKSGELEGLTLMVCQIILAELDRAQTTSRRSRLGSAIGVSRIYLTFFTCSFPHPATHGRSLVGGMYHPCSAATARWL